MMKQQASSDNHLIPFIAPKEGNYYTIWEILWLSCYFPKPVIYRKAKENNRRPCARTIQKWLTKRYFKEERIRKLLQHDEVGSREWLIKINILSKCGYAPKKDVLVSMFGVNTQPLVNEDKSISTSSSASASESTSKNCLNEPRFKEDKVLVGSRTSHRCKNQAEKGGVCKNGAYCDTNDESTAFGSEFEMTTVAQSHLNEDASEPSIRGRGGESVPAEVTIIMCRRQGMCRRHGAKIKRCRRKRCCSEGCTNLARKGGVCRRHGAYRNTNDESTAFGSEFEQATAARSQPNEHPSGPSILGQGGRGVPGEVTILCQEILEI